MSTRSFHLPEGWEVSGLKNIDGMIMLSLYHGETQSRLFIEERPDYLQDGIDKKVKEWTTDNASDQNSKD